MRWGGWRVNTVRLAGVTYHGTTDVEEVIHAEHLLIRILDNIENPRWGLFDWLATV